MLDKTWHDLIEGTEYPDLRADTPAFWNAFATLIEARRQDRACVVAQLGLSLDGRIATQTGDSKYINGRDALAHLHRLRALVDAVIVGSGTALADDPQLTVRLCHGRHPARVVIDPNGRVSPRARVWADDGTRSLVFGGAQDLPAHVERIAVPGGDIPPQHLVAELAQRGLIRLLVEGGADTLGRFLADGQITSLHLLYGQLILGSGQPGVVLPPIAKLSEALRPDCKTHVFPDGDILVACDLAPPDQDAGGTA
ncbi:RibD family protein [Fluviibacterium sp. DFM31]|uniref:RibD family protein n=1 Tax=Meridianimarinicoccus marinus TaxID=3231483 RepID=A0ABV3L3E0_9RHOB